MSRRTDNNENVAVEDKKESSEQTTSPVNNAALSALSISEGGIPAQKETEEEKTRRLALLKQMTDPAIADTIIKPESSGEEKEEISDKVTQEEVNEFQSHNMMGLPNHAIAAAIKERKIAQANIQMEAGDHDQNNIRSPENIPQAPSSSREIS